MDPGDRLQTCILLRSFEEQRLDDYAARGNTGHHQGQIKGAAFPKIRTLAPSTVNAASGPAPQATTVRSASEKSTSSPSTNPKAEWTLFLRSLEEQDYKARDNTGHRQGQIKPTASPEIRTLAPSTVNASSGPEKSTPSSSTNPKAEWNGPDLFDSSRHLPSPSTKRTQISINSDADIFLVRTHPLSPESWFQVSSVALCHSSSILRNALESESYPVQIKEGSDSLTRLNQEKEDSPRLKTIQPRWGDPKAWEIVLRILHHQNYIVPSTLTGEVLYEIAVVCFKYDFRQALLPWLQLWYPGSSLCGVEADKELFIAYVLRRGALFKRVSRYILLTWEVGHAGALRAPEWSDRFTDRPPQVNLPGAAQASKKTNVFGGPAPTDPASTGHLFGTAAPQAPKQPDQNLLSQPRTPQFGPTVASQSPKQPDQSLSSQPQFDPVQCSQPARPPTRPPAAWPAGRDRRWPE